VSLRVFARALNFKPVSDAEVIPLQLIPPTGTILRFRLTGRLTRGTNSFTPQPFASQPRFRRESDPVYGTAIPHAPISAHHATADGGGAVEFFSSRLAVTCFLVFSVWKLPAPGQTASEISIPSSIRATALSGQEFHCHTGYPLAQCQKDILRLKSVLIRYPIETLGHWTWVLVRSQDWAPISRMLRLNPESPAFTALEPRETFLEEALFVHDPERTIELMMEFNRSMPMLLEFAVSHELGHAFCAEPNEAAAGRFAEDLRNGLTPRCRGSKDARKKTVVAGEHPGPRPNALRAP